MSAAPDHALLYDAECGFCMRSLSRVMRLDRGSRLRAVAIQSEEGRELLERAAVPEAARLESWHLIGPSGEAISGGAAAVPLLRLLPAGTPLAAVLAALPRPRDAAYRWVAAHRELLGRFLVLLLAVSVVGVAGCGSTVQGDSKLTVYVSLPLSGEQAKAGEAMAAGAEQALADAEGTAGEASVELVTLDDSDGPRWTQASVAANARDATQDSTSIAYIGELDSDATRISTPITNEAGLLQVAPGPVAESLLIEPGGSDVPSGIQTTGNRTLGALWKAGEGAEQPGDAADIGYEAMALVLDSIDRAEDPLSRADVVAAFLATTGRDSRLGTYTIGNDGAAIFSGSN
jgi:predicted DCC family thiol-disulfide oxidoreductase YuxK